MDELMKMRADRDHFRALATTIQQKLFESQNREQQLISQLEKQRPDPEGGNDQDICRLRQHLVDIEEQYTQELVQSLEREEVLQQKCRQLEEKCEKFSHFSDNFRKLETERDKQRLEISSLEDRVQQYSASISNLQLVIEQIQKENERKLVFLESKHEKELESEKAKTRETLEQMRAQEQQMKETLEALGAASRLSESIDLKEELISNLRSEAHRKEKTIEKLREEVNELKNICESKVDKQVIKSLVIGYFLAPEHQKHEVKRLLARILDFNAEEMEKTNIKIGKQRTTSDESFSQKFVKFLENESKVEKVDKQLAKDLSKSLVISSQINPFSTPIDSRRSSSGSNITINSENIPIFIPNIK